MESHCQEQSENTESGRKNTNYSIPPVKIFFESNRDEFWSFGIWSPDTFSVSQSLNKTGIKYLFSDYFLAVTVLFAARADHRELNSPRSDYLNPKSPAAADWAE